jgi:hypothetical protein
MTLGDIGPQVGGHVAPTAKFVRGLLLVLAAIGSVFMVGTRTKSPLPLDAARRCQPRHETARSYCRGGAPLPAR